MFAVFIHWKKILLYFISGVVITLVLLSEYIWYQGKNVAKIPADCGVIFGAGVWRNDIPSHALRDRIQAGAKLWEKGIVKCLIVSGGISKFGSHEAEVMQKELTKLNVPQSDIFLDMFGNKTTQTLKNFRENFSDSSVIFISNNFHLARIGIIARKLGIEEFQLHRAEQKHNYHAIKYYFLREIVGILWYGIFWWGG